ncbi:MAG: C-GCAxxG-C-C family protein [Dehalococcoidia bacterium]|nr:C-GCAxxG-C-C family protein [Dehalococcoidia bacterium]
MSQEEIISAIGRAALENDHYSGCSQAVLGALQSELGIGDAESFRAATTLSGGVARRGETCGALLGALLGLGLVCGRDDMKNTAAYGHALDEAQSVIEDFKTAVQARFGIANPLPSTLCRDIQTEIFGRYFEMADDADRQAFLDASGHDDNRCPLVCATAAEVAARKILALRQHP